MPPRDDVVLWLDLETTGSSPLNAEVIEVGMVLTGPGPQFHTEQAFMDIIIPDWLATMSPEERDAAWKEALDPVVYEMHTKSGLLDDITARGRNHAEATHRMHKWLDLVLGSSQQHVILAGSGVSHFDRQFIKRDWPWLDTRLAYYMYDVGSLRRFLRMVNIEAPQTAGANLKHRALDDVFDHITEARRLLGNVRFLQAQALAHLTEHEGTEDPQ